MGGGASKRYQTSLPVWDNGPITIDLSVSPPRTPPDGIASQKGISSSHAQGNSTEVVRAVQSTPDVTRPARQTHAPLDFRSVPTRTGSMPVSAGVSTVPAFNEPSFSVPPPPDIEVPVCARALLMTWARWGRNSLHFRQEQEWKSALQRQRHPRRPSLSPQPTPRGNAHTATSSGSRDVATPERCPSREVASPGSTRSKGAGWTQESQRGVVTRRTSQRAPDDGGGSFLEEMKQEQRRQMNAQGVKLQLKKTLPGSSVEASTTHGDTPNFGIGTPGFASSAQTSAYASARSTACSSGRVTPLVKGQMSPWIMEAQPDRDHRPEHDDGLEPGVAWENDSLRLTLGPSAPREEHSCAMPAVQEEEDSTNLVYDELEQATQEALKQTDEKKILARCEPTQAIEGQEELVQYWSDSRNDWRPAKLISHEGDGVFIIDKQMSGCFAKVHKSDLLWQSEQNQNHVLRLLCDLEQSREPPPPPPQPENYGPGKIVRDDLSDDSDDD
eukprot:gnl/MRDRNA2_/MRDRNA2_120537_c0_seq1.p1 gnl/MRDRNA2_/MRDRNA2_120537_c0~~gnl/MRDRNA2_/MRDRNA2_120537_c0_seq1.p1  ORF type:complete len:499 (+),score=84.42 gnl/MRDRNA2_/MRDRNA2_120537_c0_seq1:74-1570(+)